MTPKDCLLNKIQDLEEQLNQLDKAIDHHQTKFAEAFAQRKEILRQIADFFEVVERL